MDEASYSNSYGGYGYHGRGRGSYFGGRGGYRGGAPMRGCGRGRSKPKDKDQVTSGKVAGRICFCLKEWQCITNDHFILDTVKHSHLDFVGGKPPCQFREPKPIRFDVKEHEIINGEIAKLLERLLNV